MFRHLIFLALLLPLLAAAQPRTVCGRIFIDSIAAAGVTVQLQGTKIAVSTNDSGWFCFQHVDSMLPLKLKLSHAHINTKVVSFEPADSLPDIFLRAQFKQLENVTVRGTTREVQKSEAAVPVEIYTPKFFMKAAPPNLFEAINLVNGVKPQLNCNICNTGDIHINGMEGAYTQVLIDGMPIVSGLATVYGLMGIPLSMIERIEVIKGPAAALYGSEAMAGTINIVTRNALKAPRFVADVNYTSWSELNADIGAKVGGNKAAGIVGVNAFIYDRPIDKNKDGFTDVTLQKRLSIYNSWNFNRNSDKVFTLGGRLYFEDRWGGQMNWSKQWSGTDSVYGETITTKRAELFSTYEFKARNPLTLQVSYNYHEQDSWYGTTAFDASQQTAFAQLFTHRKMDAKHELAGGISTRFTVYDDNTVATKNVDGNKPAVTWLPGIFLQHEWKPNEAVTLQTGSRADYNNNHGVVFSPRLALKLMSKDERNVIRLSSGTGFRIVNVFTEDHAALTGAREVVIAEALRPERSINGVINYERRLYGKQATATVEATVFYSHYFNKILPDYDTDPNKIIYQNLDGYAVSKGFSLSGDFVKGNSFKLNIGATFMEVYRVDRMSTGTVKEQQQHAPRWSGTFTISKSWNSNGKTNGSRAFTIDVSGNWNGPMRLPVLPNDYRPEYSPWFALLNLQLSKKLGKLELYGGVKNVLDFVPSDPIMRPFDPFDKHVDDPVNNPNNYTFDPSYNYAPLQGRRGYLGLRIHIK